MTEVYDVAIVGAGAMGSAAAWALTKAGQDVVVLEQYELGHARGGSHGATRIFRVGTEQSHYLDLAERARILWAELASEIGADLLTVTGAVEHGISLEAADEFSDLLASRGVDYEVLDAAAAAERWPGMRFAGPVLHQSGGGILHADRVVSGLQRLAVRQGATVRAGTRVDRVSFTDGGAPVLLATAGGPLLAQRVIVTVGPWVHKLLGGVVRLPTITVTQEQPRIFEPCEPSQQPHGWPCFVHWRDDGGEWGQNESYGLYEAGAGVKVGLHASGPEVDPDRRDFAPEPMRDEALRRYVRDWFPGLDPDRSTPISCLYDNTENGDFVIDRFGPITVATGFNGEGFKFVPVVGEMLRDLALGAADPPPMFTVARHARAAR
jgi:sarcosine oxidase